MKKDIARIILRWLLILIIVAAGILLTALTSHSDIGSPFDSPLPTETPVAVFEQATSGNLYDVIVKQLIPNYSFENVTDGWAEPWIRPESDEDYVYLRQWFTPWDYGLWNLVEGGEGNSVYGTRVWFDTAECDDDWSYAFGIARYIDVVRDDNPTSDDTSFGVTLHREDGSQVSLLWYWHEDEAVGWWERKWMTGQHIRQALQQYGNGTSGFLELVVGLNNTAEVYYNIDVVEIRCVPTMRPRSFIGFICNNCE